MRLFGCALFCLSWGMATQAQTEAPETRPTTTMPAVVQVWASTGVEYADTDSLTTCHNRRGDVLVLATAKQGNRVDVFDALTGKSVGTFGKTGTGPGEFQRPNGLATVDFAEGAERPGSGESREIVLVIERDNHRVQAFQPGTWESVGLFGEAKLSRPYGGSVSYDKGGPYLYVTQEKVPPEQAVMVFRLGFDGKKFTGEYVRNLGDAEGPGAILKTESIVVDDRLDRVLICEEDPSQRGVKVYTRAGKFTGNVFAARETIADPEGLVLLDGPGNGIVILTEQQSTITIWHLFDRKTYRHLGAFTGKPGIANTDGICAYTHRFGPFREGALFAVNNDTDVRAYSLSDILKLRP